MSRDIHTIIYTNNSYLEFIMQEALMECTKVHREMETLGLQIRNAQGFGRLWIERFALFKSLYDIPFEEKMNNIKIYDATNFNQSTDSYKVLKALQNKYFELYVMFCNERTLYLCSRQSHTEFCLRYVAPYVDINLYNINF